MIKTILKFLIALIVPSTLTVIYIFSETHIVKSLSTDSTGELSKTLLRSVLGVSSALIFALSYWISDLKDKLKILEQEKKVRETPLFYEVNNDYINKTTKPTFSNNLLWLPDDTNPYCPSCYGKDKKLVPMVTYDYHASETQTVKRFRCATFPKCKFHTDIVPHPNIKQ